MHNVLAEYFACQAPSNEQPFDCCCCCLFTIEKCVIRTFLTVKKHVASVESCVTLFFTMYYVRLRCCASTFLHCSNTHGKRNVLHPIAIWARICIVHSAQCTRYLAFHLCASRICTFWAHLSFTTFNQTLVVARSWSIQASFVRSFGRSVGHFVPKFIFSALNVGWS